VLIFGKILLVLAISLTTLFVGLGILAVAYSLAMYLIYYSVWLFVQLLGHVVEYVAYLIIILFDELYLLGRRVFGYQELGSAEEKDGPKGADSRPKLRLVKG